MKFVVAFTVFMVILCAVKAAPAESDRPAVTLRDTRNNNGIDNYQFDFETSNGIQRQETGELKQVEENSAIVVRGSASWTSPEGTLIELKYTADENGYHPIV
ncbi:endocuticle structural protein SgAbd-6-like [Eupeodes corollae]|uniref:endocuticle structural protein SgAbd-6-like n=1 Tax=Eupeodes corollae TaxID=290404 RepID=UPI0024909B99|nr:endocuticle structural protein SgAbd-6-like [Eupeodes corollae]